MVLESSVSCREALTSSSKMLIAKEIYIKLNCSPFSETTKLKWRNWKRMEETTDGKTKMFSAKCTSNSIIGENIRNERNERKMS